MQLNEETLWSGPPQSWTRSDSKDALEEVRRLIEQRDYEEADLKAKSLMGPYTQSYLPLGELELTFEHGETVQHYERELDLSSAITYVRYKIGEVTYTRQIFASYPDQIIAVRITSDHPNMISFSARLKSPMRYTTMVTEDRLILDGRCPDHVEPNYVSSNRPIVYNESEESQAIRFQAAISAKPEGGRVFVDHDGLHVCSATAVTLYIAAASDYLTYKEGQIRERKDPEASIRQILDKALLKSYHELRDTHLADYQQLYNWSATIKVQSINTLV